MSEQDATLDEFVTSEKSNQNENMTRLVQLGPKKLDIPEQWDVSELDNYNDPEKPICYGVLKPGDDVKNGTPLIKIEDIVDGILSEDQDFHCITDDLDEEFSRSRLDGEELLISIQGSVGNVAVVPPELSDANISRTIGRITPTEVHTLWVKYYLEAKPVQDYIDVVSSGSTRASYNIGDIRKTTLVIPPEDEQRKIANVLYTIDQAIQKTKEVIEQTKQLRTGVVQTLFRRGIKIHDSYQKTGSGEYPEKWDLVKFEDLIEDTRYGTDNKSNTEGKGYPTLRIPNIVEKRVTTDDLKHTPLDDDELERLRLEDDDILVIRTNGNPNYVGRCATFSEKNEPFVFASYLIRIQVDESRIRPAFVREFLNSQRGRSEMSGWVRSSAGNYNLSVGAIEKFDVPVPSLDEQDEIIEKIDSVEETIRVNDQHLGQLQRLKQGLMQDLISGEVRTHNKDIELADEVLQHG